MLNLPNPLLQKAHVFIETTESGIIKSPISELVQLAKASLSIIFMELGITKSPLKP
jgi:hypothetical protein